MDDTRNDDRTPDEERDASKAESAPGDGDRISDDEQGAAAPVTPLEQARNLGPKSARELRAIGVQSLEQIAAMGWEAAFVRLVEAFPHRCTVSMACSLIGAVEDLDWRRLPPNLKVDAQSVVNDVRYRGRE